jgi:hypothetical protein
MTAPKSAVTIGLDVMDQVEPMHRTNRPTIPPTTNPAAIATSTLVKRPIAPPPPKDGRKSLLQFTLFLQEVVELDAHVPRDSIRLVRIDMPAELDGVVEALEELETRLAVLDVLLEDEALLFVELPVDILGELVEYLLAVVAVVMITHGLSIHYAVALFTMPPSACE